MPALLLQKSKLSRSPPHDQVADRYLNRLAILIQRGRFDLDQPLIRSRLRLTHFKYLAFDTKLVAWSDGSWPTEFVEPCAHDPARRLNVAFDQQPHRKRSSVPPARRQAFEYRSVRRLFVEVEQLRIEFGNEA